MRLWRVFPWDPAATAGAPHSVTALPMGQGSGRFDIPFLTPVRYFAESPEHAVGERIQTLRGQRLDDADLIWAGCRLALVSVTVDGERPVIDLCDPRELVAHGCQPDVLASRDRTRTQAVAARLYQESDAAGFRWWSSVSGDWHTTVLFANRLGRETLRWDPPEPLTVEHAAVRVAAVTLGIEIERHVRHSLGHPPGHSRGTQYA